MENLAEIVELRVDRPRFKTTVTELKPRGSAATKRVPTRTRKAGKAAA